MCVLYRKPMACRILHHMHAGRCCTSTWDEAKSRNQPLTVGTSWMQHKQGHSIRKFGTAALWLPAKRCGCCLLKACQPKRQAAANLVVIIVQDCTSPYFKPWCFGICCWLLCCLLFLFFLLFIGPLPASSSRGWCGALGTAQPLCCCFLQAQALHRQQQNTHYLFCCGFKWYMHTCSLTPVADCQLW